MRFHRTSRGAGVFGPIYDAAPGTSLALFSGTMPKSLPIDFPWHCHWSEIDGPSRAGRPRKTTVWVCEHPYRTLRPSGPGPECEGCPNRVRAADGPPQDPAPDPYARLVSKLIH